MGDYNQFLWVKKNIDIIKSPVLEIGSRKYSDATFNNFRALLSEGSHYLGCDMQNGDNVDMIIDFTEDIDLIKEKLGGLDIKTVICCSVLEHVDKPWVFADNLSSLLKPGAVIFMSVPFVWEFHGYPSDYWRFTPKAVEKLFEKFDFPEKLRTISSNVNGDMQGFKDNPNDFIEPGTGDAIEFESNLLKRWLYKTGKLLTDKSYRMRYITSKFTSSNRYKKCCINMVGIRR
jgi:hypothetical protein